MARRPRFCPIGIPQHIIQRGNNRQLCFGAEEDYKSYLSWLQEYSQKYGVDIHAWVLMSNHVHLLCTPKIENSISKMMQSLGRSYVRYFNYTYQRTGTLWEGRFKACLVGAEDYLFHLYRYIELNPVRAAMVESPADYQWSSYHVNGLGMASELCTPHPLYLALATKPGERCLAYRKIFDAYVDDELLSKIRSSTNKGVVLGNDRFIDQLEQLSSQRLREGKKGRPVRE